MIKTAEGTPTIGNGGMKYDAGKPLAGILYQDFPRALNAVVGIGSFGAKKYERSSWKDVPNAEQRYYDAFHRHLLADAISSVDDESGLLHLAHAAWGILAVLELRLAEAEGIKDEPVSFPGKLVVRADDLIIR